MKDNKDQKWQVPLKTQQGGEVKLSIQDIPLRRNTFLMCDMLFMTLGRYPLLPLEMLLSFLKYLFSRKQEGKHSHTCFLSRIPIQIGSIIFVVIPVLYLLVHSILYYTYILYASSDVFCSGSSHYKWLPWVWPIGIY